MAFSNIHTAVTGTREQCSRSTGYRIKSRVDVNTKIKIRTTVDVRYLYVDVMVWFDRWENIDCMVVEYTILHCTSRVSASVAYIINPPIVVLVVLPVQHPSQQVDFRDDSDRFQRAFLTTVVLLLLVVVIVVVVFHSFRDDRGTLPLEEPIQCR